MNRQNFSIPCLSIRSRRICIYSRPLYPSRRRPANRLSIPVPADEKIKRNAYRIKKRIYDAVALISDTAREKTVLSKKYSSTFTFRLAFVTLTLPGQQIGTDKENHYRLFRPFMRRLKSRYPSLLYVWRAETQANGNLHYHLVINEFIDHRTLRNLWNLYAYRYGYRTHDNPNSTDIHSLRNVSDEAAYIAKYITKQQTDRRQVEIKMWDCSEEIKEVKPIQIEMPNNAIMKEIKEIVMQYNNLKLYDYCSVVRLKKGMLQKKEILSELYRKMVAKLTAIQLNTRQRELCI